MPDTFRQAMRERQARREQEGLEPGIDVAELERQLGHRSTSEETRPMRGGRSDWVPIARDPETGLLDQDHYQEVYDSKQGRGLNSSGELTIDEIADNWKHDREVEQQEQVNRYEKARGERENAIRQFGHGVENYVSPQDQQRVATLQRAMQQNAQRDASIRSRVEHTVAQVNRLLADGKVAEANQFYRAACEQLRPQVEELNMISRGIDQERHKLAAGIAQRKRKALEFQVLQAAPELANPQVLKNFKRWCVDVGGFTQHEVESTTDTALILDWWHKYRQAGEAARQQRVRGQIGATRRATRGIGSALDSKAARVALKQSGSLEDAARFMQTRRLERLNRIPPR